MEHKSKPFEYINALDESNLERVVEFLTVEHPQTIALVCLYLDEEILTVIFNKMHGDLVACVILRMLRVSEVSKKVINTVDRHFKKKLKSYDDYQRFQSNTTIDKLEMSLMDMKDKALRNTLNIINQVDEEAFDRLTRKIFIDNPQRLV